MEERQDLQQAQLAPVVIRQGFSNQLKKLSLLNQHTPRIFMVYAHSLYGKTGEEDHAKSTIAKEIQGYLCPSIQALCPSGTGHLRLNLYSDLAPQGNGSDPHNEYKEADVLYSQMCLLPKHIHSVDYVILCGSRLLQEYSKIEEVKEYTNYLRKMLSKELGEAVPNFNNLYTKAESALHTLKERCRVGNQKFHHIYTELAFLQLHLEEKAKDILPFNNLITIIIDRDLATSSSSIPSALHGNNIYIGAAAWMEKDPKAFYVAMFQLLRRLFGNPELGSCRTAIDKVHSEFIANTNPALWTVEKAAELTKLFAAKEAKKMAKQQAKAKNSFFALSTSSEEDVFGEEEFRQLQTRTVPNTPMPLEANLATKRTLALRSIQTEIMSFVIHAKADLEEIVQELITLKKITGAGFEISLIQQDLSEQICHIEDVSNETIEPSLPEIAFHTKMGKLSAFVREGTRQTLLNGLLHEYLLRDNPDSTKQIIEICSQNSPAIMYGLTGLLTKFAKEILEVEAFKKISPSRMPHIGFWQIGLQTYYNMLRIYQQQYSSYDTRGTNLEKFKAEYEEIFTVFNLFSKNKELYSNLLSKIIQCNTTVKESIAERSATHLPLQKPHLNYQIPEKVKNSRKNNSVHDTFFKAEYIIKLLADHKIEIPPAILHAQDLGLGYLEITTFLPIRSRKHHKGEYAINDGVKAGLEITFIMKGQRIALFSPILSKKSDDFLLIRLYQKVVTECTKKVYTESTLQPVIMLLEEAELTRNKTKALQTATILQQNPLYHQLLRLNHFLIIYLTWGGFSPECIQEIASYLVLEDIAAAFTSFVNSNLCMTLPKARFSTEEELHKIRELIELELPKDKQSLFNKCLHKGMLAISELESITRNTLGRSMHAQIPAQTHGEFFNRPTTTSMTPETGQVFEQRNFGT